MGTKNKKFQELNYKNPETHYKNLGTKVKRKYRNKNQRNKIIKNLGTKV
jgi:hypothetical protein